MHDRADARNVVRLTHDVGRWPAGTIAAVVGRGPEHALVERLDWDQYRSPRLILANHDIEALPSLAGVDIVPGYSRVRG